VEIAVLTRYLDKRLARIIHKIAVSSCNTLF
jgi:hypothetical protein